MMTKSKVSSVFVLFFICAPVTVMAAYPVYPAQNSRTMQMPAQQMIVRQPGQVQYMPQVQGYQAQVAAQSTRMTGTLPRVGSNATNAGRQYYQPQDYDRLVDSGLYLGLSVGYALAVSGGMSVDYAGEKDSFSAPGSFQESPFKSDSVIPLQISLGAAINNDLRLDFSYNRYAGMGYASNAMTADGSGGLVETAVSGGAITSNSTMINAYYNVDSYTGFIAGGSMRPYVGVGLGIALNTISDYVVFDGSLYNICDPAVENCLAGSLTAIQDIYAYHSGGTTEQLAYMLEGGLTTQMEGGLKFDFFVRYSGLGNIKSSGSVIVTQTELLADEAGGEVLAPYDSVFHYQNWYESGSLSTVDVGVRMRLQF